ncbi:MAG: putative sugar nucleotidyl transferase [Candidatus Krumholzibacteriota bacterium]
MNIVPVIFEDHLLSRMRPAAWSAPVFELRCGMFNTRERVDLGTERRGGILLGRSLLKGLNTSVGWEWGAAGLGAKSAPETRFLFLNGLLAPSFPLIQGLLDLCPDAPPFAWRSEEGLVAALLDHEQAVHLAMDWTEWEKENDDRGVWADPSSSPAPWLAGVSLQDAVTTRLEGGSEIIHSGGPSLGAFNPARVFAGLEKLQAAGPAWIWNIVDATGAAIQGDLAFVGGGLAYRRVPFGIFPGEEESGPDWMQETTLKNLGSCFPPEFVSRLEVDDSNRVHCGEGVELAGSTAINTLSGPVIIDRGVRVMPHCYLEGPLYIGPGSLVKPGARLHGDSSFGIVNRLAGEIGESTFGDFANKQHAGFIGHAVLGSWINLGALTTCSDLKNNYGEIRVDLGCGAVATGSRFVGLMMGDHAKTAIGTMFNTGTSVGFASNIFGDGMPPKFVGNFQWGGQAGGARYAVDKAQSTSAVVMSRRGCRFTKAHTELFNKLGS